MENKFRIDARFIRIVLVIAGAVLLCVLFYDRLGLTLSVLITGCVLAFVMAPVSEFVMRLGLRNHKLAVVGAFVLVILALAALVVLLLPPLLQQIRELSRLMSHSVRAIQDLLAQFNGFLVARELPQVDLQKIDWSWLTGGISGFLNGTRDFAGSLVGAVSRFMLSLMLAFYLLLYKEKVLLSLELMIPASARKLTLQMGASVNRELRQYLRGQLTIALIVGALAGIGLALVRAPSPLLMGVIVGVFNLIPYFGPLIGAIPAVLMALGQGLNSALLTALVLFIVQQLDGFWISPRVMSGMMGLSPPLVLIAIIVGSSVSGITGMFFAIPLLLIVRICLRVWASRDEMIEKCPGV